MTFRRISLNVRQTSRVMLLVLMDIGGILFAAFFALLLRMEFNLSQVLDANFLHSICSMLVFHILITVFLFAITGCYRSLWQYAGTSEFIRVVLSCVISAGTNYLFMSVLSLPIPRSYPVLNFIFLALCTAGFRLCYRFLRQTSARTDLPKKRTMLVGLGDTGSMLLREFEHSDRARNQIVCIIDDDPKKHGHRLRGVPIVGSQQDIPAMVSKYQVEEILFAVPSAPPSQRREFLNRCQSLPCTIKIVPALYQLVNGETALNSIRELRIEDLLGRDSIHVDESGIFEYITGKTILVTGGGGSIGSELCRQIAARKPERLIIFDIYENNAYELQQELKRTYPELNQVVLIGSVRDEERLDQVFYEYRPHLVYHAAAHKHVPLMEDSPAEAVKNNVFGTMNVAWAADRYGAEKMVLISTDKAVNPTSIMGSTKRICEMVTQMIGRNSATSFVSVRFGNVLGSNGSVIPLFQKQIANGGPVTVTDPEVIRYFMTIPEAVSLVLQAGVYAVSGEIFVLDMGQPVKIDDLARNMIRMSGYEPDVDIKIVYTGLRPGEKLYEELLLQSEGMRKTENDLIYIIKDQPFDHLTFKLQLHRLREAADANSPQLRDIIHEIVPEFQEQGCPAS